MTEALTQKEAAKRLECGVATLRRHTTSSLVRRNDDDTYPWPEILDDWKKNVLPQESLTQIEAATRLGLTERRVRSLSSGGVLSRNPDGSYPYPKVQAEHGAFIREAEERSSNGDGDGQISFFQERARLTKEKADAQEMENAIHRGELVAIEDVDRMVRRSLERVSTITKELPTRYGPILAQETGMTVAKAKKIMGEISESIRGELRDLAA